MKCKIQKKERKRGWVLPGSVCAKIKNKSAHLAQFIFNLEQMYCAVLLQETDFRLL
jgi:hypothetical protein